MKITVETIVKAPIEQVWAAHTTPEDIVRWNAASADWHTTKAAVDLRVVVPSPHVWKQRTELQDSISPGPIQRSRSTS